jgi:hypothetical protein
LSLLQGRQREHLPPHLLTAVTSLAVIYNREGDPFTALVWALFALQHSMFDERTQAHAETLQSELENQLTPEQIADAQAQAAQLNIEKIVAVASRP